MSVGCDGGEAVPVESSSVEECLYSVGAGLSEREAELLESLDQVVGYLSRSVRYIGLVPRDDLGLPPDDGSTQRRDLR